RPADRPAHPGDDSPSLALVSGMVRTSLILVFAIGGCLSQISNAVNPPAPTPAPGGGTTTCAQIVTDCDASCTLPSCLHNCSASGTEEGRTQHDALLTCGEGAGCLDEACMREHCPAEVQACEASAPPAS
ncbi:MAG TPA: hypothetical protein VGC41_00055, partial [Kofleriaceae bacterium]